MLLPGRLKDTTLGDVLGTLFRARATGTLELTERSPVSGRVHRITFDGGRIVGTETSLGPRVGELLDASVPAPREDGKRIGQSLLERGLVEPERLRGALRTQMKERVSLLFGVADADLRFRVPRPLADDATRPTPLETNEILPGRPRAKVRSGRTLAGASGTGREAALRVLGLDSGATSADIQAAFRRLAARSHPDRFESGSSEERRRAAELFRELSSAYHALTG